MAKFSPTDAVFAGFRFARERPATILIWAAFLLVAIAVTSIAMFDIGGESMTALGIAAGGSNPDPQQIIKLMEDVLPATLFGGLLMTVFGAVLSAAILRVRLTPGPHPWGGLRLGGEELRLLGAKLLVLVVLFAAETVIALAASTLEAVGAPALAALGVGLVLLAGLIVRLSLSGAVSQIEGRISPVRSVQLTRSLFWRLLGAYVLLGAILLVILVLVTIIFTALMGAVALAGGGGLDQMALGLLQGRFNDLNPLVLVIYVASSLVRVWILVVAAAVFLSVAVDAYEAAVRGDRG